MVLDRITSFSQNNLFQQCPRTWYMKYIQKIPGIEDLCYAHRGNVAHKTLEEYYPYKQLTIEEVKEIFNNLWKKYKLDNTKLKNKKDETWLMILNGINHDLVFTSTELKIWYPDVVAYLDCVNSNEHIIADWKTSTLSEHNKLEYEQQGMFYAWLYYRKFGVLPKKVTIYYLKYSGSKGLLEFVPTMEGIEKAKKWHLDIREKMEYYINNPDKLPEFNTDYFFCPYKHLWYLQNKSKNEILNFIIYKYGNFFYIKGDMNNFLDKHFDDKYSYELKTAHFIKKRYPNANTTIRLYSKKLHRFPIGFFDEVIKSLYDYAEFRKKTPVIEIVDKKILDTTVIDMPDKLLSGKELRSYQQDAVNVFVKYNDVGMLEIATGAGKSLIATEIVRQLKMKTLFVVDKKELLIQIKKTFEENLGLEIGQYGSGKKDLKDITVATIQSLTKNINEIKDYLASVRLLVMDECFISSTKIKTKHGNISIGKLYQMFISNKDLPQVLSLNEITKDFEYKKINKIIRKEQEDLLNICYGTNKVKCTPSHRFLTINGWKKASDLLKGDLLYCNIENNTKRNNFMRDLNNDQRQLIYGSFLGDGCIGILPNKHNYRMRFVHGVKQLDYLKWKINIINGNIISNGKSGYCKNIMYRGNSHIFNFGVDFENNLDIPTKLLKNIDSKGLAIWFMDDGSFYKKSGVSIIHSNAFDYIQHKKIQKMFNDKFEIYPKILIAKKKYYYLSFNKKESTKLHKLIDKYIHPSMKYKKMFNIEFLNFSNKQLNNGYVAVTNIKKVNNIYGNIGIQQKPYVYDIDVAGNHNYIISNSSKNNGIVVHNCHKISSKSYYKLGSYMPNTEKRLGITATAFRDDGNDLMMHATGGRIKYSLSSQDLIEQGYLMRPKISFINYNVDSQYKDTMEGNSMLGLINEEPQYHLFYPNFIVNNKFRNEQILKLVEDNKDKSILILVKLVEHGNLLEELIPDSVYLYGDTNTKVREKLMDDFRSGERKILISTISIFAEGIDIPSLDMVINAAANKGDIKSIQVLGRVLRKCSDKSEALYFDFIDNYKFFRPASMARIKAFRNEGHEVKIIEK